MHHNSRRLQDHRQSDELDNSIYSVFEDDSDIDDLDNGPPKMKAVLDIPVPDLDSVDVDDHMDDEQRRIDTLWQLLLKETRQAQAL